jgi:hypothetical protein
MWDVTKVRTRLRWGQKAVPDICRHLSFFALSANPSETGRPAAVGKNGLPNLMEPLP